MPDPEERESAPSVLGILGLEPFSEGPAISPPSDVPALEAPQLHFDAPPAVTEGPVLTRREARERERVTEPAFGPAAGRGPASTPRGRTSRIAKKTSRRDAVRAASAPKKTIGARLLSVAAMLFTGALAIGMSIPANAFDQGSTETQLSASFAMPAQTVEIDNSLVSFSERDAWSVTSWAEMLRLRYGTRSFDYAVGVGPIRWPFPYPVTISSGYGARAAPCQGCSTMHSGIDFTPGAGAAIFAIADGVVVTHQDGHGSWGNYVVIQHVIDGQVVLSSYAHMQTASSPLAVGDVIKVGDFVGLVGDTGEATGSHLHFTISIGSEMNYVDPFTWLKTHAS